MSLVLNGNGTIQNLVAGGLPDGSVTADDIASTLDLSGKTVTLPAGTGGKVLQVVSSIKTGIQSISYNAGITAITDLSVNITPSSTSSKILVQAYITSSSYLSSSYARLFHLYRNGSEISGSVPTLQSSQKGAWIKTSGALGLSSLGGFNIDHGMGTDSGFYLDSPNSTSQQTYAIYLEPQDNTSNQGIHINRNQSDAASSGHWEARSTSGIIVMEIAG